MMARRGRRQPAAEAASNQSTEPWFAWWDSSSCEEPESGSRFRRAKSQPRTNQVETRNDDQEIKARRGRSQSRERTSSRWSKGSRPAKNSEFPMGQAASTSDSTSLRRRADIPQKKVVYKFFSENPFKVLAVEVEESPPRPKDKNHVVLKVTASTVSFSDCLIRRGISFNVGPAATLPATPGMDVVGSIIQMGENVQDFKLGDRVAVLVRTGGNARYISVSASDLVAVPRACDSTEAVCMVSTFMTAYQCIRTATDNSFILKKKRVLITGGTEPVGQALIQLCFRAGATEVFASGPDRSQRYIRTVLGAKPLPADPNQWMDTMKGSVDVVFDGTCHDGFKSTSAALNEHGILVSLGMSALLNRETPGILGAPMVAYWEKLKSDVMPHSTSYEVWNSFRMDKEAYKLDLAILLHLLKQRFIKPHIAKRVSLSEVADAHHILEHKDARGEIVCRPWKRIGNA